MPCAARSGCSRFWSSSGHCIEPRQCRRFDVPTPPAANSFRNVKSKSGTRIINLLVPVRFRSSCQGVPPCITNFGNRALVASAPACRYPGAMNAQSEILFERRGTAGLVTLNRPQALNAVSLVMVRALRRQLDAWRTDPAATRVGATAAGERAFSAGGDLRQVYDLGRSGRQDEALTYWREEYALNTVIKRYPKPFVALLDGIVMGGGVGVSVHGSHRVAGDKFLFAMPEVAIGFFPDVGATWFLPRMPGEFGTYCAVTGERLKS